MKKERLIIPGLGIFALIGGRIVIAPPSMSKTESPLTSGAGGGAEITDQPSRSDSGIGEGRGRVEAKGGADEQTKPWNIFDNDDDDPTGGASSGDGAYGPGGVDSGFDFGDYFHHHPEVLAYGATGVLVIGLIALGVSALVRGGGTRHVPAY